MSAKRTKPSRGRADVAALDRMTEAEIKRTSPPELKDLPPGFWKGAVVVHPQKTAISLRMDPDVLRWFKSSGPGYQTRINAVLRHFVYHHALDEWP